SSSAWKIPMQNATPKSPTNSCLKPCNGWASTGRRVSRSADHMNPTGSPSAGKSTKTSSNDSKQADSYTRPTPPQQKLKHATLQADGTTNEATTVMTGIQPKNTSPPMKPKVANQSGDYACQPTTCHSPILYAAPSPSAPDPWQTLLLSAPMAHRYTP